jgi:predicted amidohydrolase
MNNLYLGLDRTGLLVQYILGNLKKRYPLHANENLNKELYEMISVHDINKQVSILLAIVLIFIFSEGLAKSCKNDPNAASSKTLKVATTQFPVSEDIESNAKYIKQYIKEAAANKADIIQFCEGALTGYAGSDFESFEGYDWKKLRSRTHEIMALANKESVWVVLGSAHYISDKEKPTNCLYIISDKGKIEDRYDKSMLTGGDLKAYTPGNHFVTMNLKGFKCGFLICYDICYPELFNAYRHKGVKIMFHSFYNARFKEKTILDEIKPAWIRVRAADNRMWVIASNSSGHYSSWGSCIGRPDGSLASLERGVPGILYREFPDTDRTSEFDSWTHNNKKMALAKDETYHNGKASKHPRATNTKSLP